MVTCLSGFILLFFLLLSMFKNFPIKERRKLMWLSKSSYNIYIRIDVIFNVFCVSNLRIVEDKNFEQ